MAIIDAALEEQAHDVGVTPERPDVEGRVSALGAMVTGFAASILSTERARPG